MSLVKIHLYRSPTEKQQKFLLTYLPQMHSTISQFLEFAIKALDIQHCTKDDLVIQNQGYTLPHCLDGIVIKQMQLLTIKVKNIKKLTNFWTAQKIDEQLLQACRPLQNNENHIEVQSSQSQQSTPKFSQHGTPRPIIVKKDSKQQKLKKAQQRHEARQQLKKSKKHKIVQQSQKEQQSEQQQQQVIRKRQKKNKKKNKKNKKVRQIIKQSSEQQQEQEQIQKQQKRKKSSQKYESQQQSSEQQLPRVIRTKKVLLKQKILNKQNLKSKSKSSPIQQQIQQSIQQIHHQSSKHKLNKKQQPIQSSSNNQQEQQLPTKQPIKLNQFNKPQIHKSQISKPIQKPSQRPVNYSQRKKIIEADDIQSSDVSSEEQIKDKYCLNPKQSQFKMLPPALRNKFEKPNQMKPTNNHIQPLVSKDSFKKHQQQQWVPVTKQILQKHKKLLPSTTQQTPFSQPNNLIKFKQIELDEQRFVPITSQWIEGTVENVQKDGKLKLIKVTQLGRQYRDRYEICEHNMVEFQINKNYLTKQQKQIVLGSQNGEVANQNNVEAIETKQIPSVLPVQQSQPRNSVQKFICGQVNYYFGDKNYPFDLFMQMHANKHPQKYIPVRFLLNFPKIKKILKDENKLFQYLVEDEKRGQRNFEIDEQKKMVRKKIARVQIAKQKENISQQKIIVEQQIITENN